MIVDDDQEEEGFMDHDQEEEGQEHIEHERMKQDERNLKRKEAGSKARSFAASKRKKPASDADTDTDTDESDKFIIDKIVSGPVKTGKNKGRFKVAWEVGGKQTYELEENLPKDVVSAYLKEKEKKKKEKKEKEKKKTT